IIGQQSGWLRRCQLLEHDRFEELASLAAIGELSRDEYEEFLRHKETCPKCREIVAEISSVATAAFLAGSPKNEDPTEKMARHRRLREGVARRLPVGVPAPFMSRYKRLVAAGIAAAFILGAGVGGAVGLHKGRRASVTKNPSEVRPTATVQVPGPSVPESTEALRRRTLHAYRRATAARPREKSRAR